MDGSYSNSIVLFSYTGQDLLSFFDYLHSTVHRPTANVWNHVLHSTFSISVA